MSFAYWGQLQVSMLYLLFCLRASRGGQSLWQTSLELGWSLLTDFPPMSLGRLIKTTSMIDHISLDAIYLVFRSAVSFIFHQDLLQQCGKVAYGVLRSLYHREWLMDFYGCDWHFLEEIKTLLLESNKPSARKHCCQVEWIQKICSNGLDPFSHLVPTLLEFLLFNVEALFSNCDGI